MSGDVQPRKRKDKKRKKDEVGVEETRGTAAVFGEGDVFMHSQTEHGTGGHWCAKIIFFSLLAILVTLIGLIILENRGLSELEANAVESRYSGVLEGWLEDAPDDDHHDEHTLELKHHENDGIEHEEDNHLEDEDQRDEEDFENSDEINNEDEDDSHELLEDDEDNNEQSVEDDDEDDNQQSAEDDDEDDNQHSAEDDDDLLDKDESKQNEEDDIEHYQNEDYSEENNENYDVDEEDEERDVRQFDSEENQFDYEENKEKIDDLEKSYDNSNDIENDDESQEIEKEDEEDHEEAEEDNEDLELEKLEKEASEEYPNEEPISTELPALPEDDDTDDVTQNEVTDATAEPNQDDEDHESEEDEEYLEADDVTETSVEHITASPGKPLVELEEETSSEQPPDTLAEEEEYEKRQEELRREEEKSSHMWLKLTVGGALLVATHAVMRRAARDSSEEEEPMDEIETSLSDRRMTLIPDDPPSTVPVRKVIEEMSQSKTEKGLENEVPTAKPTLIVQQESEEEEDDDKQLEEEEIQEINPTDDKELYSDEDDEEEVLIEIPKVARKQSSPVLESQVSQEQEEEAEELDEDPASDVEIIDDEQLEEEEDEEEISDVDDAELLSRLEAKYGKLPEPERPGQKYKEGGGNSVNEDWPGEPSDAYWRAQLDSAERELRQGEWAAAETRASADGLRDSARARWIVARSLDKMAEARRDNRLLSRAITAYLHLLKMEQRIPDKKLLRVTRRTLDRIQFRGNYLNAEPVYRLLIRRFPKDPVHRNNLTISFLMANRADLAEDVLKETLKLWPDDRVALAHYGFVLKTRHNMNQEAVEAFKKALEGDNGPATEARFYYHYGDSLLLLGRTEEAHEVHKRGTALGHFLSPVQRSLYNVPRLKSRPWWRIEETPYTKLAKALERSWKDILKEAEAAKALYEKENEGLREFGEWSQLDLFVQGREVPNRCNRAPVTCAIVKSEPAAIGCRRGQIKFSSMAAGTHVRPHVGPTNCRLRMHLALSNTKDTFIRVDKEIRQWQIGKTFMFDDSFEHEVWHNGTATRLVLIVDVWHPDLTPSERRSLPAI